MIRYLEPLAVVKMTGLPLRDVLEHSVVHEGKRMVAADVAAALREQALAAYREALTSPPPEHARALDSRVMCMVRRDISATLPQELE